MTSDSAADTDNPAQLSADLSELFLPGVIAAELTIPAPRTLLTAAELQFISHCADKRIQDFTAGRACAHRALGALGIREISVVAGRDRAPIWPASVTGSITHTYGYAAAAVALERDIRGIGVDCEVIESVDEELWSRICTTVELDRLAQLPAADRSGQAALIFAAKEAFYKCQYPLTRQWVGFEHVIIEPAAWPATSGSFRIIPQVPLPLEAGLRTALVGRFRFRDRWVVAGVTLPN